MSTGMWFGVALAVGGIVFAALAVSRHRRGVRPDLGSVSEQWVVHHRASQSHELER